MCEPWCNHKVIGLSVATSLLYMVAIDIIRPLLPTFSLTSSALNLPKQSPMILLGIKHGQLGYIS